MQRLFKRFRATWGARQAMSLLGLWMLFVASVGAQAADITGRVFFDADTNGVVTGTDVGIERVTVRLFTDPNGDGDPADGSLVSSNLTGSTGSFSFSSLADGSYVVVELDPPGYRSVADSQGANDNRLAITLSGSNSTNNYFLDAYEHLAKSVDQASANVGDTLTYTMLPFHRGNTSISNAVATDTIPAGAAYVAGSANAGGVLTNGAVRWELGSTGPGTTGTTSSSFSGNVSVSGDTYIDAGSATANFGSNTALNVNPGTGKGNTVMHSLLIFDLSGIPSGAVINSAWLRMEVSTAVAATTANVYRMTTDWTANGATWNTRNGSTSWAGGGAFSASDYNTNVLGALSTATTGVRSNSVLSTVQNWVNGTTTNRGFVLISSGNANGTTAFYSNDEGASSRRPVLILDWSYSGTTNVIDVIPSLVSGTSEVQVVMRLTSPTPLTNVTPNASLATNATGGVTATLVSGPTPTNATVHTNPVSFTYFYRVTAGSTTGSISFTGGATASGGTFSNATSDRIPVVPALTFQVAVTNPPGVSVVTNIGSVTATNGLPATNSLSVTTRLFSVISGQVRNDTDGDGDFNDADSGITNVAIVLHTDPNGDGDPADGAAISTNLTDASGNFRFSMLNTGNYVLVETDPANFRSTADSQGANDNRIAVALSSVRHATNNVFLDTQAANIIGQVREDADGDGDLADADAGITNVTIILHTDPNGDGNPADGAAVRTNLTDSTGHFTFSNMGTGNYVIVETDPAGYVSTADSQGANDNRIAVTLAGAVDSTNNVFLDTRPVTVSGQVRNDLDNDGDLEDADPGLTNVTVRLFTDPNGDGDPADGVVLATNVTDASGNFIFTNVMPGKYVIVETDRSGFFSTADSQGANDNRIAVTLTSGVNSTGNIFLDMRPPNIGGQVREDLNGNGNTADADPALENAVVILYTDPNGDGNPADGAALGTNVTGATGFFFFPSNLPGHYVLVETDPTGFISTADSQGANDNRIAITLYSDADTTNNVFLDTHPAAISGEVRGDTHGNGDIFEANPGIAAVVVRLFTDPNGDGNPSDGTAIATNVTDAGGAFIFTNITPGVYVIVETDPPGYVSTADSQGANDNRIALTLLSRTDSSGHVFLDAAPVTVSGQVRYDADADGDLNDADIGVSGVTIILHTDPNGDGNHADGASIATNVTDSGGHYSFTNIMPGAYVIEEVIPSLHRGTMDADGGDFHLTPAEVVSGEDNAGNDFLITRLANISGQVREDLDGNGNLADADPGLSGATLILYTDPNADGNPADGVALRTNVTGSSGNFIFINMDTGNYVIVETDPAGYTSTADSQGANDNRIAVHMPGGVHSTNNVFLDSGAASISGQVREDMDGDGDRTDADPGLTNVTVVLYTDPNGDGNPADGTAVATNVTDAGGNFVFTNRTPGAYVLVETDPAGAVSTADSQGANDNRIAITLQSGINSTGNVFLDTYPATISGQVRHDTDYDGDLGDADAGLSGVTIVLHTDPNGDGNPADGAAVSTNITDGSGNFIFTNRMPGAYVLVETDLSGYVSTADSSGANDNRIAVALLSRTPSSGHVFLDHRLSSISGFVRYDADSDGDFSDPDSGIERVTVILHTDPNGDGNPADGAAIRTNLTGSSGAFSFTNLSGGHYILQETDLPGYRSTADSQGANDNLIALTLSGSDSANHVFLDTYELLAKYVDTPVANVDDVLTYTLVPFYAGNIALTNVVVTDAIPAGTRYVTNSANAGGILTNEAVRWALGSTAPGTTGTTSSSFSGDISVSGDTYIDAGSATANFGSNTRLNVNPGSGKGNTVMNSLLIFDLSGIPAGAVINSAWLRLEVAIAGRTVHVFRATTDWTENGATWNTRNGSASWAGGGAFSTSDYNTNLLGALNATTTGVKSNDVLTTVQSWVQGTTTNRGFVLVAGPSGADGTTAFYSNEEGTSSRRPALVLNWNYSGTTNTIDVSPSLVGGTSEVKVVMSLSSPTQVSNVTPILLATNITGGATVTLISGPSPASATVHTNPVSFTYFYRVASGSTTGSLSFTGGATASGGTFVNATSDRILISPPLTFQVSVTNPPGVTMVTNRGSISDSGSMPATNSLPVTTEVLSLFMPITLNFGAQAGHNPVPQFQTFVFTNNTGGMLAYTNVITYGAGGSGWLNVQPTNGSVGVGVGQTSTATVTSASLAAGTYYATNTVNGGAAGRGTVRVVLTITNAPTIALSKTSLTYTAMLGNNPSSVDAFTVTNSGHGVLDYTNRILYDTQASGWFSVAPATGLLSAGAGRIHTGTVVSANLLASGTYLATNAVTSSSATNSPQNVIVSLIITNIPNPQSVSVTADLKEFNRLAAAEAAGRTVLVTHLASNTPSAPANGTAYNVGDTIGSDGTRVIFKFTGSAAVSNLEHVVAPGTTNFYRFHAINNDRYSPGTLVGVTNGSYEPGEIVETFSYTNGQVISSSHNGGVGWTNAWGTNFGSYVVVTQQFASIVGFPDPQQAGNSITGNAAGIFRSFAPVSTGKIYAAVMMRTANGGSTQYCGISFFDDVTEKKFYGEGPVGTNRLSVGSLIGTRVLTNNTDYTLIVMYDFAAGRAKALLYTNGTEMVPFTEPATWHLEQNDATITRINRVRLAANTGARWDELRVVASWSDLVQVPVLAAAPTNLYFESPVTMNPAAQTFTITNAGGGILYYTNTVTYSSGASGWLSLSVTNGSLTSGPAQDVVVTVTSASLPSGTYFATNRINAGYAGISVVVVTLVVLPQSDPDLPFGPSTEETIPAGSYVIPMDTNWQALTTPFNLKSYGLINQLLQTNIPVKWAIREGKSKDGVDFTGNVSRIYPSALAASNRPFRAGPFIIHKDFTNAAWKVITNFANNVAVFALNSNTVVDIRYTLGFKPNIAVLNDGDSQNIHITMLTAAGITNYSVFSARNLSNDSCYTFASEPHYKADPLNLASGQVAGARSYILSGGNFLAQCVAIETYENNTNAAVAGRFHTTKGIVVANVDETAFTYPNADLAYSQFQGELEDGGGSVEDWRLATGSEFTNNTHAHVQNRTTANTNKYAATAAKIFTNAAPGSMIFYLGGHEYKNTTLASYNGRRMYLNAIFYPSDRGTECGVNFLTDLAISKDDRRGNVVEGMTNTYYITVTNLGPGRIAGATILDTMPSAITAATWTCTGSVGAVCYQASGSGLNISNKVDIPVLGTITMIVRAVIGPVPNCVVSNMARVVLPEGIRDPNTNNNVAFDLSQVSSTVLAPPDSGAYSCPTFVPAAATNLAMFLAQGGFAMEPFVFLSETNNGALGTAADPYIITRVYQGGGTPGGCAAASSVVTQFLTVIQNEAMPPDVDNVNMMGKGGRFPISGVLFYFDADTAGGSVFDTAPEAVASNIVVSAMTWNGGVPLDAAGSPGRAFSGSDWLQDDRYFGFTIVVSNGWMMKATNVLFDYRAAPGGPTNWIVRSSVDNYVTGYAQGRYVTNASYNATNGQMSMTLTGTNTFRIYSIGGSGELRLDNVVVQGVVESQPGVSYVTDSDLAWGGVTVTGISRQTFSGLYSIFAEKAPIYSLYTPSGTALINSRVFSTGPLSNGAYRVYGPLADSLPALGTNNIQIGTYTAVVVVTDYSIPCPDPIPRTVRQPIAVADDDEEGPAITNLTTSSSGWTNDPIFVMTWETNVWDPSGVLEFRISTNDVAPSLPAHGFSIGITNQYRITNTFEGIITNFLFAVDADADRPNDTAKGSNRVAVRMLDMTPPAQVTGVHGTNGLDFISELILNWTPVPDAGNRQSDNAPLSPWYSYLLFYVEGTSPPTLSSPFVSVGNGGSPALGIITSSTAVVSNLFADTQYTFAIAGMDRAGNIGPLSTSITLSTMNFVVTQGLVLATSAVEVAWLAAPQKEYDVLFVDALSFANSLTNQWDLMETVTNNNLVVDRGNGSRIPPDHLVNTLRFYRVSQKNTWQIWNNPRRASKEVYALKTIQLRPGENWVSLCMEPDTNKLCTILCTNILPASGSFPLASKVSWYTSSTQSVGGLSATCVVWLAGSGWQYVLGGEGSANNMKIPLYQGFNIELPPNASPLSLSVIGRVPTVDVVRVNAIYGQPTTNIYNLVSYNVPRRMRIDELGLEEVGLRAGPNIGFADEIRILDNSNGDGTHRAPKARLFLGLDGNFRRVTGTSITIANNYIIEPDEAIFIIRRTGETIPAWTNRTYYSPPGKNFDI